MRFSRVYLSIAWASALLAQTHSPYDRLYVFGDSYSDMGEGYLDGNGPTAVAYLARDLGMQLLPCTKREKATDSLDFAISGARTGRGDGRHVGEAMLGYGMANQADDFVALIREHKIQFDPKKTLFYIAGGLNDSKLATETTVSDLESEIRELYEAGGRHFAVALMPTAIPAFSEVGKRLNPALNGIPAQMNHELAGADVRISQWGPGFDKVMQRPGDYGIQDSTHACAGRKIFQEDATPCESPDAHYYYHSGHPSTAVHKVVGAMLAKEVEAESR